MSPLIVRISSVVGALAFATAASASASYICHPDPAGTRTLRVSGHVLRYAMRGARVVFLYRQSGRCAQVAWNVHGGHTVLPVRCRGEAGPSRIARSGLTSVSLRAGAADAPDRLVVARRERTASWPLPERAAHVDVDGKTAIFSTRASREVYAIDLWSGRSAIIGLTRHRDKPQIEPPGVVFRDNLYKAREGDGTTLMKFIPRRYVEHATATVGRPLGVDGQVVDIAMDGSRVALAVRGWKRECDAVLYWNVAWRYSVPITEEEERTCEWSSRGASIGAVSLGGLRAVWTMRVGNEERVLSASSVDCFERLVVTARLRRGERVLAHAGDGALVAYAVSRPDGSALGRIDERMRGQTIAAASEAPISVAADSGRIALLGPDGKVEIRTSAGEVVTTVDVGRARAVALRATRLVVLTDRTSVDVFDTTTGARLHSWPVPRRVDSRLDVHFGVAILTEGSLVSALSLETGKRAVIGRSSRPVRAQIEAPGVAYASNQAGRATVRFVAFSRIESLLGLSPR